MCTAGDDNVVKEADIKELCCLRYALRKGYILTTWLDTSRWMVVHQDYLHGKKLKGALDDELAIHHRSLHATLTDTVVDCKLIIKRALELLAVQIVLVHNHPSGCVDPSAQDIALTERVSEASRLFDIRLLDHVIISRGAHFSFRARNMIK